MKIEHLNIPPASPSATPPEGVSPSKQGQDSATPAVAAQQAPIRPIAGEERRRTQRVLLRVRANIYVAFEGESATFDVFTLNVNPRGALIIMSKFLESGTHLVLENKSTRERVPCRVVRPPRESPEGFQVPLEFDSPAPQFWRIAFPPTDWRSQE